MARNNMANAVPARGSGEIVGVVLIAAAVMLLAALLTFDPADTSLSNFPPNQTESNWIGPVGARVANGLYLVFGLPALIFVGVLVLYGVSYFWGALSHVRARWPWMIGFLVACMGLFDLYSPLFSVADTLNITSPGGLIGEHMNKLLVRNFFGHLGGTIIFGCLYAMSLVYLADIDVIATARELWKRWQAAREASMSEEEKLHRKVQNLEEEARGLEKELGVVDAPPARARGGRRAGAKLGAEPDPMDDIAVPLGADLQPVPEPTVRDLSFKEALKAGDAADADEEGDDEANEEDAEDTESASSFEEGEDGDDAEREVQEGETIHVSDVGAATAADILGQSPKESEESVAINLSEEASSDDAEETEEETSSEEEPAKEESAETKTEEKPDEAEPATAPEPRAAKPTLSSLREKMQPRKPKPISVASAPKIARYKRPGAEFMEEADAPSNRGETKEELMGNARLMQNTLKQFGIEVSLGDITKGPTITRYELHPAPGIKLEKITNLSNNLSATLKAERINILAPVPGKSSVGIEVPNRIKTMVVMRDLLESPEWKKSKARIPLALGKDVYGKPIVADLADMPHLLIAGSTGSGKSVCINSIIASLLMKFAPDEMRFVMIDPKVVELQQYNVLPHLVVPVVTDPKKVIMALRWVITEMEKRYQIFAKVGVRNIHSFNNRGKAKKKRSDQFELKLSAARERAEAEGFAEEPADEISEEDDETIIIPEKLSYVVVIIDELADLMLVAPADVEMAIARITQMARAAGIHCIVATQRPSVDVITGVIKANIPSRIAFQVAAKVDSRTILDAMGADKLLGKGDMLYLPPGSAKLIRVQGALITDEEIQDMVDFIAEQGKPAYETEIHEQLQKPVSSMDSGGKGGKNGGGKTDDADEELVERCIEVIRTEQKASVSLLQRRLRLGYTRAARIMDTLEDLGVVGPSKGAEPRDILIDLEGGGMDGGGQELV